MTNGLFAHGFVWALGAAFAGGFLTSLTPCVYPMITITVGLFGARGPDVSRARAMLLAGAYVLGIAVTYTTLGIVSALVGRAFGSYLASPWVVVPTALVLFAFGASLFGLFEFALPPRLQHHLAGIGGRGLAGAFSMGLVGGILAAPCTGPILASILAYVSTTRSLATGGILLFAYAMGMGILFFALAAFAVKLPKSGAWMEAIKSIFGIVLIVGGIYFLRPIVPQLAHYGSRGFSFISLQLASLLVGILLGGIGLSLHHVSRGKQMRKLVGLGLLIFGLFGLLQALLSIPEPAQALVWNRHEQSGLIAAQKAELPVLIDVYADWCLPCKELEQQTFAAPEIATALKDFYLIKVDVTNDDNPIAREIVARYRADTLPTLLLFDRQGNLRHHIDHFVSAAELMPLIQPLSVR